MIARRAAQSGQQVILVEPETRDPSRVDRVRPCRWLNLLGSSADWNFSTKSNRNLARRNIAWPRGRGLGGSSRINAMIWFPPTKRDWERLAKEAGFDPTANDIESTFNELERIVQPESARWLSEASRRFIEGAKKQFPNDQSMVYRRFNRDGRRWTAAMLIDGLPIKTINGQVDRILFDDDRAAGVVLADGQAISCRQRVILSAGAIGSPTILMRSGIGPSETLRQHGIDLLIDSPMVGKNLQDHLIMPVVFGVDSKHRFSEVQNPRDIARWQTLGTGPIASNLAECGGLFLDQTVQVHVTPTHYLKFPDPRAPAAMTIGVNVTQPKSCGEVYLKSSNPIDPPIINANYLSQAQDLETIIRGVRLARRIASESSLSDFVKKEMIPGARRMDDAQIAKSITRYAQTLYHCVGTCAMGTGKESVCNSRMYIHGVTGLQILDASVLPGITTGNPSVMLLQLAMMFPLA